MREVTRRRELYGNIVKSHVNIKWMRMHIGAIKVSFILSYYSSLNVHACTDQLNRRDLFR